MSVDPDGNRGRRKSQNLHFQLPDRGLQKLASPVLNPDRLLDGEPGGRTASSGQK